MNALLHLRLTYARQRAVQPIAWDPFRPVGVHCTALACSQTIRLLLFAGHRLPGADGYEGKAAENRGSSGGFQGL